jgi:hypothetical protein
MKPKNITINTFDDYLEEARMLPDLNRKLNLNLSPLEEHFFDVADKHNIFDHMDHMEDGRDDEY